MARVKTFSVQAAAVTKDIAAVRGAIYEALTPQLSLLGKEKSEAIVPPTVQAAKWYTKKVRDDLGKVWALIQTYGGRKRTLAEAAFSACLLAVCRETRHWGYVCDNTTPVSTHAGNVMFQIANFLRLLSAAYEDRDIDRHHRFGSVGSIEKAEVICGESRAVLADIPKESVDLIITSPPYFGVCDYVKAQRLSMEWFGYEIEPLRQSEVGARSKRHRRTAFDDYISEMRQVYFLMFQCLRRGGACAIVLGQSSKRDAVLDQTRLSLRELGFSIDADLNRSVSSQRRQAPSIREEHILVCYRP
jgi:hypothetical protein